MPNDQTYEYSTIYFEGTRLPRYAATIDGATTNDVFVAAEAEEDWAVWWWRFVICVGAPRSEESGTILKHAATLKKKIEEHQVELRRWIPKRLYGDPEQMISDWLETIEIIRQIASSRPRCEWHAIESSPAGTGRG